jgi:polysaccharide export outer membrane protein
MKWKLQSRDWYIRRMIHFRRLFAATCTVLAFAGHAVMAAEAAGAVPQVAPPPLLQIGRGDEVRVEVFGNPDLATTTNVADDGSIHMPLAGPVPVTGRSPAEAARRIEAALKAGEFLVDPQVTVTVLRSLSQRVSVNGEVVRPGRYVIESDSTVLDLIALAGGITQKGSDIVYILRRDESGVQQRVPVDISGMLMASPDATSVPTLRGGDSIIVPKATFSITGEVRSPGEYRIEGEMLLFQAIARAGGLTPLGSALRTEIRRRGPDDKFVDIKGKSDTRIEPGDVIKVKERLF